ncbi:MAG: tetratricopeptide repeat protein [Deltaproteobacteria bacterium]|nr:tetratricopeptide repeat protein [Deltaproteobacteria bacterium]
MVPPTIVNGIRLPPGIAADSAFAQWFASLPPDRVRQFDQGDLEDPDSPANRPGDGVYGVAEAFQLMEVAYLQRLEIAVRDGVAGRQKEWAAGMDAVDALARIAESMGIPAAFHVFDRAYHARLVARLRGHAVRTRGDIVRFVNSVAKPWERGGLCLSYHPLFPPPATDGQPELSREWTAEESVQACKRPNKLARRQWGECTETGRKMTTVVLGALAIFHGDPGAIGLSWVDLWYPPHAFVAISDGEDLKGLDPSGIEFNKDRQLYRIAPSVLRHSTTDYLGNRAQGDILRLNYPRAEAGLETALALDPDSPFLCQALADLRYRQGRWQDSVALQTRATQLMSASPLGYIFNADRLFTIERRGEAVTELRKAITLPQTDADAFLYAGWVALYHQEYAFAEQALARAAVRSAEQVLIPWMQAEAENALGRWDAAQEVVAVAARRFAKQDQTHEMVGWLALQEDRPEVAERAYRTAIRMKPEASGGYQGLGDVSARQGNWPAAVAAYAEALDRFPARFEALMGIARAEAARDNKVAAIRWYERALQVDPLDAEALFELSRFGKLSAHFHTARTLYEQACGRDSRNIVARRKVALLYAAESRFLDAKAALFECLNASPQDPDTYRLFGKILERQGLIAEAIEAYQLARQYRPHDLETTMALARLCPDDLPHR